jgi:putative transcriptional regulator
MSYAAGAVSEGESLLVATHAALCAVCRRRIERLEQLGGALLSLGPSSPVGDGLLARTLDQLDRAPTPSVAEPVAPTGPLPSPLARLVGPYEQIAWQRALDGLFYVDLPLRHGAVPVRLRRLPPGMRIPMHSHRGAELELVLAGGAVDLRDGRHFLRGDVASNDEHDTHSLEIDGGEECVVLSVQDARVAPRGLWSRLVFGYLRW